MRVNNGKLLVTGALAGCARTLVSYPIDTLRVSRQTGRRIRWHPRSLYAGVTAPLATGALVSCFVLNCERTLSARGLHPALSGALTGLLCTALVAPIDAIKVQRQTDRARVALGARSWASSAAREAASGAVFFSAYRGLLFATALHASAAGALAGLAASVASHPLDCIKTRCMAGESLSRARRWPLHAGLPEALLKAAATNAAGYAVWTL